MQAALITVGDELLAGDTENTNATWLARRLSERGVTVRRILTIPDDRELIAGTVREYADAFDAVVVTGGLGGTHDDVTMDAVADVFDRPLAVNDLALADVEETLAGVRERYPDIDIDPEAEASIPEGSRPLINEVGLAPGCVIENVYVFPGIPDEMEAMFESVAAEFEGGARSRWLHTTTPEADLVAALEAARDRFDVAVGSYPQRGDALNRIKLTGEDDAALEAARAWLAERVAVADPDG